MHSVFKIFSNKFDSFVDTDSCDILQELKSNLLAKSSLRPHLPDKVHDNNLSAILNTGSSKEEIARENEVLANNVRK